MPPETRSEIIGVEQNIRIAVEEHKNVPRQQGADMAFYELYDLGA